MGTTRTSKPMIKVVDFHFLVMHFGVILLSWFEVENELE